MANVQLKTVSKQSADIYRLLQKTDTALTAQDIAVELNILPNAVYRVTNKLVAVGMLQKIDEYPVKFKAVRANTAINWYLLAMAQSFRKEFEAGTKTVGQNKSVDVPTISFIRDRESLIKRTEKDILKTKKRIDYIVSGHNVPDSTALAYRRAIAKGVKVRSIWQESLDITKRNLKEWKDIGVDVRFGAVLGMRLFILDSRIVYLTSYDLRAHDKAFGIRFDYGPIAQQMEGLFEENWLKAKEIEKV